MSILPISCLYDILKYIQSNKELIQLEKIKDFFHDFSDVFFAIAVTSVMFVVLSLNLGSWFNNSSNTVLADEPVHIVENNDTNLISEDNTEVVNLEENENLEEENSDIDKIPTEETEKTDEIKSNNDVDSKENEAESENTTNFEVKTIVIPNGTPGSGVAIILKENGLIDDTKEFIQTAENLNLAVRLKSGSFEIHSNDTIEDMVKIIAGQKR